MTMVYDEDIFQKYRALAITSAAQLEIGKTYYSNLYPNEFTIFELLSENRQPDEEPKDAWFRWGPRNRNYNSLHDRNVGASYNPWLIFADKATRDACASELIIKHVNDPDDLWDCAWDDLGR